MPSSVFDPPAGALGKRKHSEAFEQKKPAANKAVKRQKTVVGPKVKAAKKVPSAASIVAKTEEDELAKAKAKCEVYSESLAAIQKEIREMVICESPKVEEIGKGEFEMSTEKQKSGIADSESRLDSGSLDSSQAE